MMARLIHPARPTVPPRRPATRPAYRPVAATRPAIRPAVATRPGMATRPAERTTSPLARLVTRRGQFAVLAATLALAGLAWLAVPDLRTGAAHGMGVLRSGDQDAIGAWMRSFGAWGPVVSLGLMVAQAIVAPIPGALVVFANGIAFVTPWGTTLSVVGQTLAAVVCFGLARVAGRGPVEAMVGRFGLEALDRGVGRWGPVAIVVLRLVPGVAFDATSYGAGLLDIRFRTFVLATVAGIVPQTLVYTWMVRHYPALTWAVVAIATGTFVAVAAGAATAGLVRSLAARRRTTRPD